MNANQIAAFEMGTGEAFTAASLLWSVQAIGATAVLSFVAWVCVYAYIDYGKSEETAGSMIIIWGRSVLILMITLSILIN